MTDAPDRGPGLTRALRSRPGRPAVLGAAVVIALLLGAWLYVVDPERHADGRGPLGSLRGDGAIGMSTPIAMGDVITFGLELCTLDGSTAVVESVQPHTFVGSGATLVGSRMRTVQLTANESTMIGSAPGFPPIGYDPALWTDAIGYSVTHRCEHPNPTAYTELILGLRADGKESGGWHGVDVGYQSGWRHRIVTIQYNLLLCRPTDQDCDAELLP